MGNQGNEGKPRMTSHKIEIVRLRAGEHIPEELAFLTPAKTRLITVETSVGNETFLEIAYITTKLNRVK